MRPLPGGGAAGPGASGDDGPDAEEARLQDVRRALRELGGALTDVSRALDQALDGALERWSPGDGGPAGPGEADRPGDPEGDPPPAG